MTKVELVALFEAELEETCPMTTGQMMRPQKGDPPEPGIYIAYAVVDDAQPNLAEAVILEWDEQWLCPHHNAPCKWKIHAWIGPMAVPEAIH